MSEIWMFTAPFKCKDANGMPYNLKFLAEMYRMYDGKRYQIGIERGRNGYRHVQGRIEISADTNWSRSILERVGKRKIKRVERGSHFFDRCARSGVHCTKTEQWSDYEGKEGYYVTSEDNTLIKTQRFGELTHDQKEVLKLLESNNDREITVWYDDVGGVGKSWLTGALWERRKAHQVRMTGSAEGIIKDVCSKMSKDRRPIVIVDIPRSGKWTKQIYEAIEVIKDGLIDDPRYSANAINIKGVKVLVMCNSMPKLDKLSKDRWIFYNAPAGATNTT